VDPADCVVVEDAVAGLRAARSAGCRALVAVLGTTPREELEPVADLVVADLSELTTAVEGGRLLVAGA
jgi:sugar-phosphatase